MSKREIRAKRLVAAVLLAISVQMWSAPPLWAAEASVQTETSAAGEAKETKDAKAADSETGGEADTGEEETVVVPVIGYSTRSAAGSDYGVMPLADMAVDGALTGVTGINGSELVVDKVNNNFFIGTIQDGGSFDKSSKNNAAIGLDIYVDSNGNSSVFGAAAKSWGESASVFGAGAESGEYGSVFGAGAEASEQYGSAFGAGALAGHSNTVAFGYSAKSTEWYSIAVGAEAKAEVTGGIAIGALANVGTGVKTYGSGIAIGMEAHTNNDLTIALGYNAESTFESSIAVGANSATTAAYQVAFGTGEVKTVDGAEVVTWTDRRSLAGISDIDMAGALTGVNKIDMKNGALTGISTINGNVLVPMNEDVTNKSLAIGTGADFKNHYSSVTTIYKNAIAIGNGAYAGGNGSLAIGFDSNGNAASAGGVGSISLNAMASGDHNVIISGWADAYDSVVIGYGSSTDNSNVVAIGNGSYGGADGTVLGYAAGTDGRNSVAIGAKSSVASGDDDKVSFGHKVGDINYADGSDYSDDLFRSLINVADIDMHGNISLGGEWSWNDAGTSYKSNGLGNLTGVTGINGIEFLNYDCGDGPVLAIGSTIGNDSTANSVGLGINTIIEGYGSVAIGVNTNVRGIDATGVGSAVAADGENSVAVGSNAFATADGATAVGSSSRVLAEGGSALGYGTSVAGAHTNSVAIGAKSATGAANQVSFGHKVGDRNEYGGSNFTDDLFRSLVNVADIEMHGALTGVTGIDGVTVSGTDASTGLTVGGNAVIGKTDTPFSSTGFAVAKDGAVTAKTVNGATITGTGFNGVTLSTDGKVNGAAITSNSFNGVTLEKGADSHYKVGGVDVTKMQTDVAGKADAATTLTGYGITDAYTKTETDTAIGKKADKATTLTGYGIADAYTKTETDTAVGKKADKATTLTGYGITDAYTKTAADEKITAATADMATKTQVTADIGTAKTALESAYQAADNALSGRATALETKTAKFNTAGDNLTGMANITSTAATLGGVGFASAGVMTGVASIDGIAIDASRNLSKAGTYNGVTVAVAGISGTSVFNGAAITNNSFNGVTLEKGADNHYKVGGVDVSALKTTVDSISADGVGTADTAGIKRDTTGTATTTIETNTAISSSGITTNKATVSGATATTLENGKLTVGAAAVQNTGFAVGSSSLNNGSLTVDGNNKLTTAGLTASKVTVGAVIVSGGKVSGLTDAALSTVSTEAVTGKQLNATNTTVSALDTAYKAADTQIRTDFAAADTALKTELNTAIDEKAKKATDLAGYGITDAYTKTAADEKITAATADMATKTQVTADIGTAKTALESAYQAADTALSDRAAALETAATGMSYDAGKNTTTFTGGVTATVLTAGEFKVGATGFGFGSDGALTAKTVNGIEIKKDESKVMVGGIDLTALSNGDVVTDNTKGIGRNQDTATTTIETNTAISSSGITTNAVTASGTVKAGEFVEGSQKLSDKYAAKTALADYTTTTDMNTKFADYATTTAVDTKLADYAKSDSVYSKAAADTAFAKAGDVDTLKTTVGDADGGLVKDVTELQSGKADKATTLAGYGIADAYTQTEINEKIVEATKDLATSATVTDIQSGLEEVTGKTAGLSYDTASGSSKFSGSVVIGNEGAKTHTQITDDAIIFGEGTDKQVTVDASGIHVGKKAAGGIALYADADGTHIDHTSLVTGSVTADNLNGVAISGNATDGLSVGGVSIKALSERLDSLEQDGVATADMGGIKRTDVVENSGKTIIEDTTSFTKDGLKTANLEAATAALGGVNFAAGAVTGVSSINGVVFGSDGKIGGVSLSGGKVDGVDVGWLDQRVKSLEDNGTGGGGTGGGGSSANTSGIHKPDRDTTNIEGNTSITTDGIDTNKVNASDSIVVADGEKNKTVISKDGILVAEGEKNQVKINEDGIHVGKNSSVVNDTDGFITDKGLYIGVSSSSDTSTAKFSVAPNGNLSSKAGDYGFSNTSADGAKFTHSGDTAYGTGSQLDTTIQGNKVTTGRIDTDELYVDGNKVTVAGGTIGQTDAVDNHLSGTDADGNTVTNDFKTSAVNGTTQAAEKTSADGKESTKTVNNTSAGGTSVTTSKTTTDSKDNVTVKESSFGTNEKGMTLSTSNKVTDKDGKVTKDTSGTTTMTGDSISVSKTTTTTEKDADGNEKEVTKTSGTTIGSGEVTLKREDGSTIEVGSAIEGMQSDMRELDGRVNRMGVEIKEVGALSAALAGLHPQPENANSRADFAMAMGSYEGKQALAVGGFYRPDKRTMLSIGASTTSSKHMMNMGISIALDRLPEAERRAKEAAKAAGVEQETLNRVLERLAALEQDNRRLQADNEKRDVAYEKLAADYTQLKEKYIEETADRQQPEQAEAEE